MALKSVSPLTVGAYSKKGESGSSLSSLVFSTSPHDGSAEIMVSGPIFKRKFLQMLTIDNQTKLKGK